MKISTITFAALLVFFVTASQAYSGERQLIGTFIGAGGGALIGQAIGGDTESTLLGTAVGSVIGLTATSINHHQRRYSSVSVGTTYHRPPRAYRHYKRYQVPRHYFKKQRHHVRSYYKHRPIRHSFRGGSDCRTIIKHVFQQGHNYTIKKRICKYPHELSHKPSHKRYERRLRRYDRHERRGNFGNHHRDF